MMMSELLSGLRNLPDIWGEGALFAFSGMDGETNAASNFVATYTRDPLGLLIETRSRRILDIELGGSHVVRIATGDVLGVEAPDGEMLITFSAWDSIVGIVPPTTHLQLKSKKSPPPVTQDHLVISEDRDNNDVLVLARRGGRFALCCGRSFEQARERAEEGLRVDVEQEAVKRLAVYGSAPSLSDPAHDRLLRKCISVMKVNTLAPEGAIKRHWTTPDRVPHKLMWMWDTVFNSMGMNWVRPRLSCESLLAVLETQRPDGMVPLKSGPGGETSQVTNPPVLAWGIWENYRVLRDKEAIGYALPHLERWMEWIFTNRDRNGNDLLEWFVQPVEDSPGGESGMDNSPRFDGGEIMDAVDFSTLAAQDMRYMSMIARELGELEKAEYWGRRSKAVSRQVHDCLWDETDGFYYDLNMEGKVMRVKAISGFYPLLLDDIPPSRVERIVDVLTDREQFNTPCPVPTVAISEGSWSTDMWCGPTWINTNHMVITGLRKHRKYDQVRELTEKTIEMVRKYYERYGVLFEYYDSRDETPPVACHRKGPPLETYDIRCKVDCIRDFHWTAALTAQLLLENRDVAGKGSSLRGS